MLPLHQAAKIFFVRAPFHPDAPKRVGSAAASAAGDDHSPAFAPSSVAVPASAVTTSTDPQAKTVPPDVRADVLADALAVPLAVPQSDGAAAGAVISAELGRAFLLRKPEAWRITAGLFGRTFAHAPALLLRLYTAEDAENLCRLGRILEKAAPCVGAERLASAAHDMQWAVNDADTASAAQAVEECVLALREVLEALEGRQPSKESKPSVQQGGR